MLQNQDPEIQAKLVAMQRQIQLQNVNKVNYAVNYISLVSLSKILHHNISAKTEFEFRH